MEKTVKRILSARVYDVANETPIHRAMGLSQRLKNQIFLKREDLQTVFCFKIRGAYNKMASLSAAELKQGVITASAGNHAQGVALAGKKLGIKTIIVMPRTTPTIKVDSVKRLGGQVVLHGDTYEDATQLARKLVKDKGFHYVHPFDDPAVIAGQGTVGVEILRQHTGPLDALFVPVGGGGLMAGVAAYVKFIRPEIKLIAVEAEDSACLKAALEHNRRVKLSQVGLFADGVAVAQIGKEPFRLLRKLVDDLVTVTTDEICAAVKDIFDDTRAVTEPAGALALAGLKKYAQQNKLENKFLMSIVTGANVNFDRLRHISERAEIGEKKEIILSVTIEETAGSFKNFCNVLGKRNITEFNYRFGHKSEAQIFVGVEISGDRNGKEALLEKLSKKGFQFTDMSDNETAKLHIRHMVGGRARSIENEVVYRFEFPERPGALMKFLNLLGQRWNISMFHYRNHGAAYGRVLVGIQVPKSERREFKSCLSSIGFRYWEETDNVAYQTFLAPH